MRKTNMIEALREAIGTLNLSKFEAAQEERTNVREQIARARVEVEALEGKLSELAKTSLAERLAKGAAAGEDLDSIETAQSVTTERLSKLRYRIEMLERELRKYEGQCRLAWAEILTLVEGSIDRVRGSLSPELTTLFKEAEKFNADGQSALSETLLEYKMSLNSFGRAEETLAVYPVWDANQLPLTMWLIPNVLIQNRGLVEPPRPTKKED
jgi:predicted  nucleic acid-binding Zn-ribbon protein